MYCLTNRSTNITHRVQKLERLLLGSESSALLNTELLLIDITFLAHVTKLCFITLVRFDDEFCPSIFPEILLRLFPDVCRKIDLLLSKSCLSFSSISFDVPLLTWSLLLQSVTVFSLFSRSGLFICLLVCHSRAALVHAVTLESCNTSGNKYEKIS